MYSVLAVIVALLASPAPATPPTPTPLFTPQRLSAVVVHAPRAALTLEVARTEGEHERGLMDYTSLPAHTGMIFVFSADAPVSFWMKDTLIPLDMVFVGASGRVRKVFAHVATVSASLPDNQIPLETARAKFVIELSAREAAHDGIIAGTMLPDVIALAKGVSAPLGESLPGNNASRPAAGGPTKWGARSLGRSAF